MEGLIRKSKPVCLSSNGQSKRCCCRRSEGICWGALGGGVPVGSHLQVLVAPLGAQSGWAPGGVGARGRRAVGLLQAPPLSAAPPAGPSRAIRPAQHGEKPPRPWTSPSQRPDNTSLNHQGTRWETVPFRPFPYTLKTFSDAKKQRESDAAIKGPPQLTAPFTHHNRRAAPAY